MDIEGRSIGRSSLGSSGAPAVNTNEKGSLIDFKTPFQNNEFDFNKLKETIYEDQNGSNQNNNGSNEDLQGLPQMENI